MFARLTLFISNDHLRILLAKIEELLPVLVAAVTLKDWTSVKEYAVRLKYLQGIDLAAEAWPNQPFDH